jgi:hypothetical protein
MRAFVVLGGDGWKLRDYLTTASSPNTRSMPP